MKDLAENMWRLLPELSQIKNYGNYPSVQWPSFKPQVWTAGLTSHRITKITNAWPGCEHFQRAVWDLFRNSSCVKIHFWSYLTLASVSAVLTMKHSEPAYGDIYRFPHRTCVASLSKRFFISLLLIHPLWWQQLVWLPFEITSNTHAEIPC